MCLANMAQHLCCGRDEPRGSEGVREAAAAGDEPKDEERHEQLR